MSKKDKQTFAAPAAVEPEPEKFAAPAVHTATRKNVVVKAGKCVTSPVGMLEAGDEIKPEYFVAPADAEKSIKRLIDIGCAEVK